MQLTDSRVSWHQFLRSRRRFGTKFDQVRQQGDQEDARGYGVTQTAGYETPQLLTPGQIDQFQQQIGF